MIRCNYMGSAQDGGSQDGWYSVDKCVRAGVPFTLNPYTECFSRNCQYCGSICTDVFIQCHKRINRLSNSRGSLDLMRSLSGQNIFGWMGTSKSWLFQHVLVGGLEHDFYDFPYIGNVIIPTDFHSIIFQRGREKPPTRI